MPTRTPPHPNRNAACRSVPEPTPSPPIAGGAIETENRYRTWDPLVEFWLLGQVIHGDFQAILVRHELLERDDPQIITVRPGSAAIGFKPRVIKCALQAGVGEPRLVSHIDLAL